MAAVAHHFEGHPLGNRTHRPRVGQQSKIGMTVDVDKTRRDPQTRRLQHPVRGPGPARFHARNAAVFDRHIRAQGCFARAVDYSAAPDEQIR